MNPTTDLGQLLALIAHGQKTFQPMANGTEHYLAFDQQVRALEELQRQGLISGLKI